MSSVYFTFRGRQNGRNHKRLIAIGRSFDVTPEVGSWYRFYGAGHSSENNHGRVALPTRPDAERFIAAMRAASYGRGSRMARRRREHGATTSELSA